MTTTVPSSGATVQVGKGVHSTLVYQNRLIDGADAGRFLQALKERLQNFEESWV